MDVVVDTDAGIELSLYTYGALFIYVDVDINLLVDWVLIDDDDGDDRQLRF